MAEDIEKFKYQIDYDFSNKALLKEALTHRSFAVENNLLYDNQRMEFLGDAVLQILLTEFLYLRYPEEDEGAMTKMRSAMVQQEALAKLARKLELGRFMYAGKGEIESGGEDRDSTLSDLFEAFIGAYYLDAGFDKVRDFVNKFMGEAVPEPDKLLSGLNPKGTLQEYTQKRWGITPEYEVISVTGPDHNPSYLVGVAVNGKIKAEGSASNRKQAESQAARSALIQLAESDSSLGGIF